MTYQALNNDETTKSDLFMALPVHKSIILAGQLRPETKLDLVARRIFALSNPKAKKPRKRRLKKAVPIQLDDDAFAPPLPNQIFIQGQPSDQFLEDDLEFAIETVKQQNPKVIHVYGLFKDLVENTHTHLLSRYMPTEVVYESLKSDPKESDYSIICNAHKASIAQLKSIIKKTKNETYILTKQSELRNTFSCLRDLDVYPIDWSLKRTLIENQLKNEFFGNIEFKVSLKPKTENYIEDFLKDKK